MHENRRKVSVIVDQKPQEMLYSVSNNKNGVFLQFFKTETSNSAKFEIDIKKSFFSSGETANTISVVSPDRIFDLLIASHEECSQLENFLKSQSMANRDTEAIGNLEKQMKTIWPFPKMF